MFRPEYLQMHHCQEVLALEVLLEPASAPLQVRPFALRLRETAAWANTPVSSNT